MAAKACCIETCHSSSERQEDVGVTYHKFPKDPILRSVWVDVTHHDYDSELLQYVCSRHFCKSDFQTYKDSKYILKSDAVPSIFSWKMAELTAAEPETNTDDNVTLEKYTTNTEKKDVLNNSKESEGENLDAIKAFIEAQDNKTEENKTETNETDNTDSNISKDLSCKENPSEIEVDKKDEKCDDSETNEEKMRVASSVIDMILCESEAQIANHQEQKPLAKRKIMSGEEGNSMNITVGSKVEAKDFEEFWHPAEILEVDYDEMEVLVHYEDTIKKHDEWINVSSPRLRPRRSSQNLPPAKSSSPIPEPIPSTQENSTTKTDSAPSTSAVLNVVKEEPKDRFKLTFDIGERCLARWRDNRRFIATVNADLGDGKYEIIFDDGVKWTCSITRLSKLKDASKKDPLTVDTTGTPSTCSTPSPIYGPGPSNPAAAPTTPQLSAQPFNTHLFDPTRDYLGSKSERREMKRKLNIKEIFNIGQKKKKVDTPQKTVTKEKAKVVKEKKPKVVKKKIKEEPESTDNKIKKEIPDAVASIIGTIPKDSPETAPLSPKVEKEVDLNDVKVKDEAKEENEEFKIELDDLDLANSETLSAPESQEMKDYPVMDDEIRLEKFEQQDDTKHEEVIDRIKEVINKLEDGINQSDVTVDPTEPVDVTSALKEEIIQDPPVDADIKGSDTSTESVPKEKIVLKVKKERLFQGKEKKTRKQMAEVQTELEEVRRQVEEIKKQISQTKQKSTVMPESFLLPGEWCCKWVNGQPVGTVSEIEHETKVDANNMPVLPRRSVQVEDKRLPPGWTKHMVRRSLGHSAGKWDVVLMSPDNRRFHTKTDMKQYLENYPEESLKPYEYALLDFGIHVKLSRRMGWYLITPDGEQEPPAALPIGTLSTTSPLVRKKQLSLKKSKFKDRRKKKLKLKRSKFELSRFVKIPGEGTSLENEEPEEANQNLPLEDGCVYVGSLKVQVIENLLRCPAEGCLKNFRNNTLLKMHIKHYHRELRKMLGATPKVLDLAYARTRPSVNEIRRLKLEAQKNTFRVKLPKLPRKLLESKLASKGTLLEPKTEPTTPGKADGVKIPKIPRSQDSPKLRNVLNKQPKRPKVLLPVRRPEPSETVVHQDIPTLKEEVIDEENIIEPKVEVPPIEPLDFETAISTHTVTKPYDLKRKGEKKKKFASISKMSEDEEWFGMNSDVETRSSYPRSGSPDSKLDQKLVSSESNEEQKEPNYMYTETGERIKIVHMKREEIINCHCGFREEDGLMVQCELCLCWQHALCHNIQKESEVPEKYTCSICLNPRRGRRSQRFLHDQDRLYEGLLPGAKPCETLRRSHELSGNLHRIEDALHALRVKYHVATQKNHPKLYLWAKDWEMGELVMTQERLNSDYSDLNIMISSLGKENLPVKPEDVKDLGLDIRTPPSEEADVERFSQKDNQLGSQSLLSGLLSSPGGGSLDLPITTTELEKLAKAVQQEQEPVRIMAPQPEAAIENSACRERLLRHITRCQHLIDSRLDSIEAQVAELESQDPSLEDDETPDFLPRTKQTIQMLMRDLDTMEELGIIT